MSQQYILDHALIVAQSKGYQNMTKDDIAHQAWRSQSLVSYHLGSMERIREAVMYEAVRVGCAQVVAQGLAMRDPIAMAAPDVVKQAAKEWLC